ncbi:sulfate transmembrane transporter [Actinidia rufa]|uniref:Sulfate transmembrane transporter n=1 Tax=Actinidia rufa TaxID=165716 RepID=A0A7J0E3J6_9ERIC|nr:sulfate transmembrane transporter [Actinidia rufa]
MEEEHHPPTPTPLLQGQRWRRGGGGWRRWTFLRRRFGRWRGGGFRRRRWRWGDGEVEVGNQGQGEDDGDVGAEVAHGATKFRPDGGLEAEVGGEEVAPPLTLEERCVGGWCSSSKVLSFSLTR